MTQLTLSIPQTGLPNSTEDAKVASDLTQIQTVVNGNLDTNNLATTAAIKFTQLASGAGRLAVREVTAPTTAVNGDLVTVTGGTGPITLPTPTAGTTVGVVAPFAAANGATTVNTPSGLIFGASLGGTGFQVGTSGVVLCADGTNWVMAQGVQDTGWVALTLVNSWTTLAGYSTPAYRLVGDRGWLRGGLNGTAAIGATIATLPTGVRPPATVGWVGGVGTEPVGLTAAGVLSCGAAPTIISIDGMSFGL